MEDSIIITKKLSKDERVANVYHPQYKGYNPFNDE